MIHTSYLYSMIQNFIKLILILGSLLLGLSNSHAQETFQIGLVADIQYSDQNSAGTRLYRKSLDKVSGMIDFFNKNDLKFIVDLGDRIDKGYSSFEAIESVLSNSAHPIVFVPGNHDYAIEDSLKKKIREKTESKRGYHSRTIGNWQLVFLNGLENSLIGHPQGRLGYYMGKKTMNKVIASGSNNGYNWNGGLGIRQTRWLYRQISMAEKQNLNVLIFCHQPIFPNNAHSLWNYQSIIKNLRSFSGQLWWISGHDHKGGFEKVGSINMLTLHGMVEGENPSYGILTVSGNVVALKGYGDQSDL
jgi:predicted phosphodiesterase